MRLKEALAGLLLLTLPTLALAGPAITPDSVRSIFDANAMLIMFIWGFLHSRLPFLAKLPNTLIPWFNAAGYILLKLAVPDVHAGVGGAVGAGFSTAWLFVRGPFTAALAALLYDKFLKAPLDVVIPKAR